MSSETHAVSNVSLVQKMIVIFGGIIAPIFVIFTMTKSPEAPKAAAEKSVDRSDVLNNIKPLAVVEMATESGPKVEKSGEEIVNQSCAACHGTGMMASPKLGDSGAWASRIAQGYETLTKHAIEGIGAMPARGGNPDFTDNEIAKAVAYMANQAGASFIPPESAEPEVTEAPVAE